MTVQTRSPETEASGDFACQGVSYKCRHPDKLQNTQDKTGLCLSWLAPAKGLELLFACLEPTMTELGGSVNELELDLLQC